MEGDYRNYLFAPGLSPGWCIPLSKGADLVVVRSIPEVLGARLLRQGRRPLQRLIVVQDCGSGQWFRIVVQDNGSGQWFRAMVRDSGSGQ